MPTPNVGDGADGLSSRQLGVNHKTGWMLKHKLMQVMEERKQQKNLPAALNSTTRIWAESAVVVKRGWGAPGNVFN